MKTLRRFTRNRFFSHARITAAVILILAAAAMAFVAASPPASAQPTARTQPLTPKFSAAVAFDVSPAVRNLPRAARPLTFPPDTILEVRQERGPEGPEAHPVKGYSGDAVLQLFSPVPTIPAPLLTFEGLSNQDNFNIFGFRVNPPDPNGEVGPNNYVEIINLVFGVYDKAGNLLVGPVDTGTLWSGFPVSDCTDPSGDPVVLYDQFMDRWILSQFTTAGPEYFNCVAVSTTSDPTGSYYRYAFSTGLNFPDYPKYGNWTDSYVITTREFGPTIEYGIGVYALEKNKMVNGDPNARNVRFFIDGNNPDLLPLVGDGLLPADVDGKQKPKTDSAIPLVGTQDDGGGYGATFDALNIWDLTVKWRSAPAGHHGPEPVPRHPVVPAAADLPAGLPELQNLRDDGDQSVGRGDARRRRRPLVRDSAEREYLQHLPAGHLRTRRRRPSLDGKHRHGQEGQHGPRLQRGQRDRRVSGDPLYGPACRRHTR